MLQELELFELAAKLGGCKDYESLGQTGYEVSWAIDDMIRELQGSLTVEQKAHYVRAARSAVALGYLSRMAHENCIINSFFAQFLQKAVFAYSLEDKSQDIMDKLEALCKEADIDLDAIIRRVSEED